MLGNVTRPDTLASVPIELEFGGNVWHSLREGDLSMASFWEHASYLYANMLKDYKFNTLKGGSVFCFLGKDDLFSKAVEQKLKKALDLVSDLSDMQLTSFTCVFITPFFKAYGCLLCPTLASSTRQITTWVWWNNERVTVVRSIPWEGQMCAFDHFWPGETVDVTKYLKSCHRCQTKIFVNLQNANNVLHPIPISRKIGPDWYRYYNSVCSSRQLPLCSNNGRLLFWICWGHTYLPTSVVEIGNFIFTLMSSCMFGYT